MEERITALEENHEQLTQAIMELNSNLASMGFSTTESIKAIMEGFQSMNNAIHGIVQNFAQMEARIEALENKTINTSFTDN